jgi:hypothetical protein
MPRLELIFPHSANGGGCNARGCEKGKSTNCGAASLMGINRARGSYVMYPVLSEASFLTYRACNPRITPATSLKNGG